MVESQTLHLLQRWHGGDRGALDALLERDLPWVRGFVERRLGDLLRKKGDVDDYVQDAMIRVLEYGPRFLVSDRRQFRALLGKICENTIREHAVKLNRKKRDVAKERPIPRDTILALDPPARAVTRVSVAVDQREQDCWLRLGVDLLDAEARQIVLLRDWDRLSFAAIGTQLSLSEDACRMRYNRVLPRLAQLVEQLTRGELDSVLAEQGGIDRGEE